MRVVVIVITRPAQPLGSIQFVVCVTTVDVAGMADAYILQRIDSSLVEIVRAMNHEGVPKLVAAMTAPRPGPMGDPEVLAALQSALDYYDVSGDACGRCADGRALWVWCGVCATGRRVCTSSGTACIGKSRTGCCCTCGVL